MGRRPRVSRGEILRAAREAFAERGYEGTTLAAISTRVGLSPAALLRHSPTKEALFAAAMTAKETEEESLFFEFLEGVPGDADPRKVLRRLAEGVVPFFELRIGADVARYLHARPNHEQARGARDMSEAPSELTEIRRRGFTVIRDYMRRASKAGRLRVLDPEAAAIAFMGSLVSYVFLHRIAKIIDPPLPFDRYLDNLIGIWTRGAIRIPKKRKR
ncbi:MAG TPA: TetR/AcrR family transcriptional regulator [Vicinamibacteria bacterium]|jgi:TetR/AcrR family transcriptional repressor of mexJK operon|nr:TetR/AcrR family transcriptional regulator [Vicinamibacteria bacterium]